MWTQFQQKRLAYEKKAIEQYFPGFQLYDPVSHTYWFGCMITNSNFPYYIRIEVPDKFPDQPPRAYIVYPCPIYMYDGTKLASIGASHQMHTYTSKNGWVQMCLFRSECWSSDYSIIKCLKKARIWLEAYDTHIRTGKKMCDIVESQ